MIVEFIGATGAGKTTLITDVQHKLAHTGDVPTAFEFIAGPLGLRGITHPTVRNLTQELVGLPFAVVSLPRYRKLISFSVRMLARQGRPTLFTANNLRSLVRKIGVYETIRRTAGNRAVLVDEGTVHLAHNLFVYTSAIYSDKEIAQLASYLPLPDVIVYVKAPVESLITRSLQRADPPRELRAKSQAEIEVYIHRAVIMFEQLVQANALRNRIITVENPEITGHARNAVIDNIAEFILSHGLPSPQDQLLC